MRLSLLFLAAWCGLFAAGCASRRVVVLPPLRSYLRVAEATNGTVTLEVAVRTLVPIRGAGPPIRMVGVTHLGTAEFYKDLQELLDRQSLVLFEGVGAADKQFNASGDEHYSLQPALARALGLRFQLQAINYQGSNFVNSDLTLPQLQQILSQGPVSDDGQLGDLMSLLDGSSWLGAFVRFGLTFIESSPRLQATVRLVMIETLGAVDGDLGDVKGLPPELRRLMDALINERNRVVVSDLRRAVANWPATRGDRSGRGPGIAVFYGAGHMVDLEQRWVRELGYQAVAEEWRPAFSVNPLAAGLGDAEVRFARGVVREQLKGMRGR